MLDKPSRADDAPVTPAEVLAGAGAFVLYPLVLVLGFILSRLFAAVNPESGAILSSIMFWIILAALMASLIVAWRQGFPRWSFPLWALMLALSFYMMQVATPGLWFFGCIFGPRDLWGWRAWIPLAIVVLVATLWTRARRPLGDLIAGVWRDWTRLSFALYGCLPFVFLITFDEIVGDELVMLALDGVLALGALVYMRATRTGQRALALSVAFIVCWSAATIFKAAYWSVPHEQGAAWGTPWASTVGGMLLMGGGWLAVIFSPALLGLARRVDAEPRPA